MIEIENESKEIGNPFPGLRPFETDEYELFFGREGQSDALISRLQRAHFLAVVGTSGSGKSSLVRAGLLPALSGGMMDGGSGWRIAIMRPGSDPIGNLALSLADKDVLLNAGGGLSEAEAQAVIEATLRRGALGLVEVARQARLAEHEKLLIVVDQFEELFRFRAARAASSTGDDAAAFVKLLLEAARQSELPIYVVPTMRSDFLGDCAQFQGLPEAINDGQYLIPRMTRDERRFAITGPVGVTRGKITEPLVNRLMNDVGDNPDQLPILQHALMRTWEHWAVHRRNGEPIDLKHYEAVGTMAEALSRHADEAFNDLPDERSRLIAEILFKTLTERGADNREIRRPTSLEDICAIAGARAAEVSAVVEVFRGGGRSFLMPPADVVLKPETVIDISHESLIRNWDRLQEWVAEEAQSARIYRRLAEAAVLHREGKEGLAIDPALQIALDWRAQQKPNAAWANRYHFEFDTAIAFLDASRAHRDAAIAEQERERQEKIERDRRELKQAQMFAEQQRRAARRLRWLSAGMAVMFLLAVVITVLALRERSKAEASAEDARKSATIALEEKRRAVTLTDSLRISSAALLTKNMALDQERADKEKEARRADERATEAEIAKKSAETEKARAEEKSDEAEKARNLAVANAKNTEAAAARGELIRAGLEASRREESQRAYDAFDKLTTKLNEALHPAGQTLSASEVKNFTEQLGWALSNFGSVQRQSGNLADAQTTYERARDELEKVWPKSSHHNLMPDRILFETYHGLGNTYHDIASAGYKDSGRRREKIDAVAYFKNAEDVFQYALKFQQHRLKIALEKKGTEGWDEKYEAEKEVATGFLNLAHLYRDTGAIEKVEQNLKALVELEQGDRDEQIAALRELAEFYRTQNKTEEALAAYNKLIDEQETLRDSFEAGYAMFGQGIANSYDELEDVYRSQAEAHRAAKNAATDEKTKDVIQAKVDENMLKANQALELSISIQRFSTRLRRWLAVPDAVKDRDDLADSVADTYARLGKFDRALALYNYALEIRTNGADEDRASLGKSYEKLAALYRAQKDYAKAEESYNELLALYRDKPRRTAEYASALLKIGSFYAEHPTAPPDAAVSSYRSALKIYADFGEWYAEDVILYRLTKLFEKRNQTPERAQALGERVASLQKYFDQLVAGKAIRPNDPTKLVSEYLQAVNALAYFHAGKNNTEAVAAYQRAFEKRDYITARTRDENNLKFYAAVLGDYQTLLNRLNNKTLAAAVGEVRDKLNKAQESKLTKEGYAAAGQ